MVVFLYPKSRKKVAYEPYFGSGAVLFNKSPAKIETVNDLDDNITNYFQVIRDNPEELIKGLELTPYGRTEYENAFIDSSEDAVEKARKFAVRCWMDLVVLTGIRMDLKVHSRAIVRTLQRHGIAFRNF